MRAFDLATELHLKSTRRGGVTVLAAISVVMMISMAAYVVDFGYLAVVRNELQNAADAAAMAGAQKLLSRELLKGAPAQTTGFADARAKAVEIAALNRGGGVFLGLDRNDGNAPDGEIVIGFIEKPGDAASPLTFPGGECNSVQVCVHRDEQRNGPLLLFFANIMGHSKQSMSATATATVLGCIRGFKIRTSGPTVSRLLPFALDINVWNDLVINRNGADQWKYDPKTNACSLGSDNVKEVKLFPNTTGAPGNFGTIDIGKSGNSTADIVRQILYGPNAADFANYPDGEFKLSEGSLIASGDTGISAGFESALLSIRGQARIIPLYQPPVLGSGNNAKMTIVAFAGVVITDVDLNGSPNNKHITIQPEFVIDPTAIAGGAISSSYFVYQGITLTR